MTVAGLPGAASVGACVGHIALGVSDRRMQNLCSLLRHLRGTPMLDTARFGLGALLMAEWR